MRRLVALGVALPAAWALLGPGGCTSVVDHVFGGYAYDPANDCLQTSGAIDVIAGADPGMCPRLRCWQAPDGNVYVTDEACDAPVDYVDHTKDGSEPCVKALAAYARPGHGLCAGSDGGAEGGG